MMSSRAPLLARLLRPLRPSADHGFRPPPRALSEGLWVVDRKVRLPGGVRIPTRATLVRLANGLLVIAPPAPDEDTCRAIAAIAPVRHVVAPNSFHYVFAAQFLQAFPNAALHLVPGLRERCPELPPAETLADRPPPAFEATLDLALHGPLRGLSEAVFLHRPTRTLLLCDLAFNVQAADTLREELFWRIAGVWRRFGPSRTVRLTLLRDREAVGRLVARILDWDFVRIVVAHGDVVERDARPTFERAFAAWS